MRVSLEWLNEYVSIKDLQPEVIAEALTNAGLEVESIEHTGAMFSGVLLGKIDDIKPHPNADRLRLADVNLGLAGKNQVVCGAPNVEVGMLIAYAALGAKVINKKEGGLFELKPVKIRGVESTGMICSLEELGLQDQYPLEVEGIWPLNSYASDTDLGKDLKEVLGLRSDIVLDTSPTANRGDLMSVIGVAREISAIFDRPLRFTEPKKAISSQQSPYEIKLEDAGICQFYIGGVLDNINIAPAPDWMIQRLTNSGVRSINNIVDITNYVMLELGQPLHAFDANKLGDKGWIGVRHGRLSEQFKALDDTVRTLTEQSVVVTLNDHPVALGGVMGGQETEISDNTNRIFLEAAFFPPASNRRSARSVGIRTESSARFERGIDPLACETAFNRAIELLEQYAEAKLACVSKDDHRKPALLEVDFSLNRMNQILGLSIETEKVAKILANLGFKIKDMSSPDQWKVVIPSFRNQDVTREIDLIEEVIRVYGYDNVPYTLPQDTATPSCSFRSNLLEKIRHILTASGLTEVTTLSLIGDSLLKQTGFSQDPKTTVKVINSHSIDHTFLRQSLIPNLLEIAKHNQDEGNENVWIFELGKAYFKSGSPSEKHAAVQESLYLSCLLMGNPREGIWHERPDTDFYTLKGVMENILEPLGMLNEASWLPNESVATMHPGQTASIKIKNSEIGFIGRLHPKIEDQMKFRTNVYLFELNIETLYKILKKHLEVLAVEELASFPAVQRDISFSAPKTVNHQEILSVLKEAQETLLKRIQLFDEYKGTQLEEGYRSMAYRLTLQSFSGTLTDNEIETTVERLKQLLKNRLPVQFR